jgi:hypothetical protein
LISTIPRIIAGAPKVLKAMRPYISKAISGIRTIAPKIPRMVNTSRIIKGIKNPVKIVRNLPKFSQVARGLTEAQRVGIKKMKL